MKTYLITFLALNSLSLIITLSHLARGKYPRQSTYTSSYDVFLLILNTGILVWIVSLLSRI